MNECTSETRYERFMEKKKCLFNISGKVSVCDAEMCHNTNAISSLCNYARQTKINAYWFILIKILLVRPMRRCVFRYMRTAKAQISLCIREVWSVLSLSADRMYKWKAKARMMLCACAGLFESAHAQDYLNLRIFSHVRRHFWKYSLQTAHLEIKRLV